MLTKITPFPHFLRKIQFTLSKSDTSLRKEKQGIWFKKLNLCHPDPIFS